MEKFVKTSDIHLLFVSTDNKNEWKIDLMKSFIAQRKFKVLK